MRVGAMQLCPVLTRTPCTVGGSTAAKSASGRTRFGDLPPSSWWTRLTVSAAALATRMPARVDPVKLTISIPGCAAIALPTVGPSPCTRLKTPAGTPAASRISAKIVAFRSEEHTSELQSLMRISYAVFCLKKKKKQKEEHVQNESKA